MHPPGGAYKYIYIYIYIEIMQQGRFLCKYSKYICTYLCKHPGNYLMQRAPPPFPNRYPYILGSGISG